MPPKRRSELPTEPSPSPKKIAKTPATRRKRTRDSEVHESVATATRGKRTRNSSNASEDSSAVQPTPGTKKANKKAEKPTAAKAKKAAAISESSSPHTNENAPKSASKNTSKSASKSSSKPAPKPKASRRSSVPKPVFEASPSPVRSQQAIAPRSGDRSSINTAPNASPAPVLSNASSTAIAKQQQQYVDPEKLSDELEIMSLWNQSLGSLFICLTIIGPIFFAVIMVCYVWGKIQGSQAIASIGVVYTVLFLMIMGSFLLTTLPFILISRVFISMVATNGEPNYTPRQVNLYCRLLVFLAVVLAGVGYKLMA